MALFKFFLIGSSETPLLDVPFEHLSDLHHAMECSRFVEGHMVAVNGEPVSLNVLIPMSRIQMIAEDSAS